MSINLKQQFRNSMQTRVALIPVIARCCKCQASRVREEEDVKEMEDGISSLNSRFFFLKFFISKMSMSGTCIAIALGR